MLPDGDIDYRGFTRAELEDALQRIDRAQYPINYSRLRRELASRPQQVVDSTVLPNRLVLGGLPRRVLMYAMASAAALIGFLLLLQAFGVIKVFTSNESGRWEKWLAPMLFLGAAGWVYILLAPTKSVVVEGDNLLLRDFRTSERVPISDVEELYWIQSPDRDYVQIAALRFRKPCAFGSEIKFVVSSASAVSQFQAYLKTRSANDDGV